MYSIGLQMGRLFLLRKRIGEVITIISGLLKIGAGYNARGVVSLVGMNSFITWYEMKRGKIVYGKRIIRYYSR